jgi:hypothetical protein
MARPRIISAELAYFKGFRRDRVCEFYRPFHCGCFFAKKARTPALKSSLA